MDNQIMTFSKQESVPYTGDENRSHRKSRITNLCNSIKALKHLVFGKRHAKKYDMKTKLDGNSNIDLYGKYTRNIDEQNIKVQQPNTINYANVESHKVTALVHNTDSPSSNSTLRNVHVTADQLIVLIENSSCLNDVRYVMHESFIYPNNEYILMLPRYLKVYGNMDLSHCINLTDLPIELIVDGDLDLSHCVKLKALPKYFTVCGEINLISCSKDMTGFPKYFELGSMLI